MSPVVFARGESGFCRLTAPRTFPFVLEGATRCRERFRVLTPNFLQKWLEARTVEVPPRRDRKRAGTARR